MDTYEEKKKEWMRLIIENKNIDVALTHSCAQQLLDASKAHEDNYGIAFAHTYLANTAILERSYKECSYHLHTALSMAEEAGYEDLLQPLYVVAGLYHNSHFDEISAVEYYMKAYRLARKREDLDRQIVVLNNVSSLFHQKNDFKEALVYTKRAYHLFLKKNTKHLEHAELILILNLVQLEITNHQLSEAFALYKTYIQELSDTVEEGTQLHAIRLCEMALAEALGRYEDVARIADYFIERNLHKNPNRSMYFSFYSDIFQTLLRIKDKERCEIFLQFMGQICRHDDIELQLMLHLSWINFAETFHMENALINSYKQYYLLQKQISDVTNKTKADSMKEKILMEHIVEEQERIVKEKQELEALANHDSLTQLFNRSYFQKLATSLQATPKVKTIGIILIDVDYFKEYNDTYGHNQGDELLKRIAASLDEHGDSRFFAARYGGDEFICLCVNVEECEVEEYLKRIYDDLKRQHIEHKASKAAPYASISAGYGLFENDENFELHVAISMADVALYQSKGKGKNQHCRCQ